MLLLMFLSNAVALGSTPFFEINQWFQEARAVSYQELSSHYQIGRCFTAQEPERAKASLLGTAEKKVGADWGPGFEREPERKIFEFGTEKGRADHFDTFPYIPNVKTFGTIYFQQIAARNWKFVSPVSDDPNLTHFYDTDGDTLSDEIRFIARKGDYLLLQVKSLSDNRILRSCYYFKKVRK